MTEEEIDHVPAIRAELERRGADRWGRYRRLTLAALAGIPWVGGLLSAMSALDSEKAQATVNALQQQWLEQHRQKIDELGQDLAEILARLDSLGALAEERVQEDSYLHLVQHGFRVWDRSATREKRELIKRLLTNAGATRLSSDDVVRLFVDWIDQYHEIHFAVIRAIYRNPGMTRAGVWEEISGAEVRDDSPEADLFKLMMRDLSTGSVLRQARDTDQEGRFLRKPYRERRGRYLVSPFEDSKPYVLTALGRQFVHYAMDEVVPRIEDADS